MILSIKPKILNWTGHLVRIFYGFLVKCNMKCLIFRVNCVFSEFQQSLIHAARFEGTNKTCNWDFMLFSRVDLLQIGV